MHAKFAVFRYGCNHVLKIFWVAEPYVWQTEKSNYFFISKWKFEESKVLLKCGIIVYLINQRRKFCWVVETLSLFLVYSISKWNFEKRKVLLNCGIIVGLVRQRKKFSWVAELNVSEMLLSIYLVYSVSKLNSEERKVFICGLQLAILDKGGSFVE